MYSSAPIRRHPSMAVHTGDSTKVLEQSLTLMDLQKSPVNNDSKKKDKQYMEHSQVFDDMVAKADVEYARLPSGFKRQVSSGFTTDKNNINKPQQKVRRHSSFESCQPLESYNAHQTMKDYLNSLEDTERSNFVESLLDFNLSVNMASLSDMSMIDESPGLHLSCPVLSYMNDDEEDSIDLMTFKRNKGTKRSSLTILTEETEQSWESLNDDPVNESFQNSREYVVEMKQLPPTIDDDEQKPQHTKRRRRRSCQTLAEQLSREHPQQVLQSLMGAYAYWLKKKMNK